MNVSVIRSTELPADLAAVWGRIQAKDSTLATPFFRPEYTQAVASIRNDVFVGIMEEHGRVVGFFPFQRRAFGRGKPAGGVLCDFQGVVVEPGIQWSAQELIRGCGLHIWDFDHLPVSQRPLSHHKRETEASPYLDLSAGYEGFTREQRHKGSHLIKKASGLYRKLEREIGTPVFLIHEADIVALRTLLRWKSLQYVRTGLLDAFRYRWMVRLLEHLIDVNGPEFAGLLSTLSVNGRLVAAHMGIRSATVWHYWLPAFDTEFRRFSPGTILLLRMIEAAPALGIRRIDFGKGEEFYKRRLANGETTLCSGSVELPSVVLTARRLRRSTEVWALRTRFGRVAQGPARFVRRLGQRLQFR